MPKYQPPAARAPGERRAANPDLSLLTTPAFSRFSIPFRRDDLLLMCLKDSALLSEQQAQLALLAELLAEFTHREFHRSLTRLRDSYAPFDPSRPIKVPVGVGREADSGLFLRQLTHLLERANFERLSHRELRGALRDTAQHKLHLSVNLDDFAEVLLFYRGLTRQPRRSARSQWQAEVEQSRVYERVMVCLRFKDEDAASGGRILLKMFSDVPHSRLDMLFPNARLRPRPRDRILSAGIGIAGGSWLLANAAALSGASSGGISEFWRGWALSVSQTAAPVMVEAGPLLGFLAAATAVGTLLTWQLRRLGARVRAFSRQRVHDLFLRVSDVDAGVFTRLVTDAEEQESKEALLVYHGLLLASEPVTAAALDQQIRHWFAYKWHSQVSFDVEDALQKLLRLGLIRRKGAFWSPKPTAEALQIVRAQIYADLG